MKKLKKKIREAAYLFNFPYGIDEKWDTECDRSLIKALDYFTWFLYSIVFGIPLASLIIILVQNHG